MEQIMMKIVSEEEREAALDAFNHDVLSQTARKLGAVSVHDEAAAEIPLLCVREGEETIPFLSKGGLTVICGAAKNGKSTALSLIMATMLREDGKICCLERANACKIGYIDTEQRKYDTIRVYKRILELAGLPEEDDPNKLQVYNQRSFFMTEKEDALEEICKMNQDGVVIADNVVDYLTNINDPDQSKRVVDKLLTCSAKYNVALVCVIHVNKGNDNKSLRGHIGSFLEQKADTVVLVDKKAGMFEVSNKACRGGEIPSFRFWYDENNKLCVEENTATEPALNTHTPSKREQAQTAIIGYLMEECEGQKAKKNEIVDFLQEEEICGSSLGYEVIKKLLQDGMLEQDPKTGEVFYCDSDAADELLNSDNQAITNQSICLYTFSLPQLKS